MIRLTRLLLAPLTVFLLGLSVDNAFAQQELTRAAKGDTVWVLLNHVKPDKVEDFERFIYEVLKPAIEKHKPEWLTNVRVLHPAAQNEDSTYTYTFIMDPKMYPSYRFMVVMEPMYGKEKAEEYIQTLFSESLKDGRQISYLHVESAWHN